MSKKNQTDCTCYKLPEAIARSTVQKHDSNCMVCGSVLVYLDHEQNCLCHYCRAESVGNAACANGHFVCDRCHAHDALNVIRRICVKSDIDDMIEMLTAIRNSPGFPMHGPEHHALVPAIILAAYRQAGGQVSETDIDTAIERGMTIAGGSCGFVGVCGAAAGAGIAFSIILQSNPYKGAQRQRIQKIVSTVLSRIAQNKAPRCCQRECWIALKTVSEISMEYVSIHLTANESFTCTQSQWNKECIRIACPLYV